MTPANAGAGGCSPGASGSGERVRPGDLSAVLTAGARAADGTARDVRVLAAAETRATGREDDPATRPG
ncbi:hypothetical protein [Modestobacter sp. SSW1-42]|uniref:hypothetical protein n=1 Tax=Modestobacter sp. SSW1-42 TaxID=596372 RepID=UPI003987A11A